MALTLWAGARFYDRWVGLVAAAILAVAFLPVFYAKHALNDVVTLVPVTVALVACLVVHERGPLARSGRVAGAAIGAATATKYTAGAMLVTLLAAAGLRVLDDRAELRRTLAGLALAAARASGPPSPSSTRSRCSTRPRPTGRSSGSRGRRGRASSATTTSPGPSTTSAR